MTALECAPMFKRLITILIAPLLLMSGCGEQPTIRQYETTRPIGFDWPETELREAEAEVDGFEWVWDVPAGWIDAPELAEQHVADYRMKGSNESLPGRMTVSKIDGDAGGVNANVMRWLKQLYVTTPRTLGPDDSVKPLPVDVGTMYLIELHGQYKGEHMPTRISGAIIQLPSEGGVYQTWFFKMAGDEATVAAHRMGMAQMILTFRPKGTPRPNLPGIDLSSPDLPSQTPDEAPEEPIDQP